MYVSNNSDYIKNKFSSVLLLFLLEGRGGGGGGGGVCGTINVPISTKGSGTPNTRPKTSYPV